MTTSPSGPQALLRSRSHTSESGCGPLGPPTRSVLHSAPRPAIYSSSRRRLHLRPLAPRSVPRARARPRAGPPASPHSCCSSRHAVPEPPKTAQGCLLIKRARLAPACTVNCGNKRINGPGPGRASLSVGHLARRSGHAPPTSLRLD
ncbi:hypothetical protein NDU88_004308 [Pleurodeles waltl]|uniref:Uncharacterized protein n=1 Tax=Pleurodeles waltl TaxID=8319 RepID=A0AAV7VKC4_PLEWA|nr:hypothetical protein NDU88_004308 [Pleurodeles waltl]